MISVSDIRLYVYTMYLILAPAKLKLSPRIYDGLSFSRGQKFKVKVAVVGKPFPKVTWIKDGETLENGGRFVVEA